jgi:phospholipase/lecithinase/hemolysin
LPLLSTAATRHIQAEGGPNLTNRNLRTVCASVSLAVVLLFCSSPYAAAQSIHRIIFFGDSLSDAGNHFIQFGTTSRQPFSVGPAVASYDIGGHHFSNGATWAEQLATALHVPNSGHPALRAPGVFTNYAVGRARSRPGAPEFSAFDLSTQVTLYLSNFGRASSTDLFVIWIGANDVDDAVNALAADPTGATSANVIEAAITSVVINIGVLYGAGARMFLVANIPDFAKTPYVQFLGAYVNPKIPAVAALFTAFYDGALAEAVNQLTGALPLSQGQFITLLDVNDLFKRVLASPADFGISDVRNRCTTPGVIANAICSNPNAYLFWDGIHPTTRGHSAVAQQALSVLPAQ